MSYRIKKAVKHTFEKIYTLLLSKEGEEISIEIPSLIFDDLNIDIEKCETLNLTVLKQKPDLEQWDIVLRARIYKIKEKNGKGKVVCASAGGLQIRISKPDLENFHENDIVYLALKIL